MSATVRRRARPCRSRDFRAVRSSRSRRSPTCSVVGAFAVRAAKPDDAPAIVDVRARTWGAAYAHVFPREALKTMFDEPRVERATAWWRRAIECPAPSAHTLVAADQEGIAGFASCGRARGEPKQSEVGELYAIYVLPGAWGRGIGRALMAEALSRMRNERFGEALLWVLEDNPRTRRFYERSEEHTSELQSP